MIENQEQQKEIFRLLMKRRKEKETANLTASDDRKPSGDRPKLYCVYCKKDNHTVDRCFKKQKDLGLLPSKPTANVLLLCYDTCLLSTINKNKIKSPGSTM